jgi:hypothetical protein
LKSLNAALDKCRLVIGFAPPVLRTLRRPNYRIYTASRAFSRVTSFPLFLRGLGGAHGRRSIAR